MHDNKNLYMIVYYKNCKCYKCRPTSCKLKKKKKTTLLYVYVSKFLKKYYACTQIYLNIFTNNQATIHDLVLLSNIYIKWQIFTKKSNSYTCDKNLCMILYSKNCKCCKYHPKSCKYEKNNISLCLYLKVLIKKI